jgi:superfamily II DNA/RNA helicase
VHRSGRTGRAGAAGTVVALIDPAGAERAERFMARVAREVPDDLVGEIEITLPDVAALESATDRVAIDRELAELDAMVRPGAVGAVKFTRPG